ncbi:MAG TPA: hypothetical protein PKC83_11130 [Gemmatimonadaceae bacterium]|nr:hypothetical protein [Gemmatimonadaceae bacterium]
MGIRRATGGSLRKAGGVVTLGGGVPQAGAVPVLVAFVWDAVDGATSYVLQVGTATTLSDIYNADVGNVLGYSMWQAPGTYYSRVVPQGAGSTTAEQVITV